MNKDKWISLYNAGDSANAIAQLNNTTPFIVRSFLTKSGVSLRNSKNSHIKAFKYIPQILKAFDSGMSVSKLAKQYNYTISGMSMLLRTNKRKVLKPQDNIIRDWSFVEKQNDLFFYWLGWMLSDGCIYYRKHGGRNRGIMTYLIVQKGDKHILEFFRDQIQPNAKIHKKNRYLCDIKAGPGPSIRLPGSNAYRLDLSIPRNIAMVVNEFGFIPNKTYQFKMTKTLKNITNKQFLQFLCGFIEGDGSVSHAKYKDNYGVYKYHSVRISFFNGSPGLIKWIRNRLIKIGTKKRKLFTNKEKTCFIYTLCGSDAIRLARLLLQCKFHELNRKWDNAREVI